MNRLYILLVVLITSCSSEIEKSLIIDKIPDDPVLTISIKEFENVNFQTLEFISESIDFDFSSIENYSSKGEVLISFHYTSKNKLDHFLIQDFPDTLSNKFADSIKYDNHNIYIDKNSNYVMHKNNFLFQSKNKLLIENVIRNSTYGSNLEFEKFKNLYQNKSKNISLIVKENYDGLMFMDIPQSVKRFSNLMQYEFDVLNDEINVLGFAKSDEKRKIQFLNNLKKSSTDFFDIIPENFSKLKRISFEYNEVKENLNAVIQDESIINYEIDSIYQNVFEVGELIVENDTLFLLNFDGSNEINSIESIKGSQFYRGQEIRELSKNNLKIDLLSFREFEKFKYFTKFENLVVFGKNENELENIILNYKNNLTLSNQNQFEKFRRKIPSKSVKFILYKNDEDLSNAYIYSAEEISDNLAYFSLFTSPSENKEITNKLELVSKTKHSQNIVVKPTLVKNHRTNDLNIIFQDLDNELILTNLNGNKIWSKKFESSIISDIYQIDMYKNGRLQFVFLTYEYLYIVDVKGNIVKKTANKENTSKKYLSVFDYDKNKNYRLVVQEGKTVSMYDSKLSVVKGYKATRSKKTIANKMDHIRILNKDFLIQYYEDKTFTIYDRRGRERIKLPKELKYQSTVFKHNNKLILQGEDNEIVRIDISGEISYQPYNENIIGLVSKQDILAIHTDNKIIVNQNEFNIPYGNYTTPKIYQNYISTLNLDTKELYLFSESKKIERFPIFSSNLYDFSTREKQTVLVVVGEQDELLYYTVD